MKSVLQRMTEDLQIRNRAPSTIEAYLRAATRLEKHFGRSADELKPEDMRTYQLHLLEAGVSWSSFNTTVCALRFLYRTTLECDGAVDRLPYGKKPKVLPVVISQQEILSFLAAVEKPKYRMALTTAYATGARANELVHLRAEDIDSARMMVHIRCGKGNKERMVPLSKVLLSQLRDYWRAERPKTWLFPGEDPDTPMSTKSLWRWCRQARKAAGLSKRVTPHTMRHCFATHLLEAGVDIRVVQVLLGHASLSTTMRYTHVQRRLIEATNSPLDLIGDLQPLMKTT